MASVKPPSEPSPPPARLAPRDVVADRYRIVEELGEGGMGVVYGAVDLELEEEVAIKLLKLSGGDDDQLLARFKQEIRLARRIHHPNVCTLYDFGNWAEGHYVTMRWVRGRSLAARMEDSEELALDQALTLFHGVLDGLEAAHKLGILHRDIKPQNIMIADDGRPVVMDFGLARELEGTGLTVAGQILGTPEYMAPERLLGHEIDPRCDVYSLGVLLFELATGRTPFTGESIFETARKQIHEPPPRPTELNAEIPSWLEQAILDMLAKQPEDRLASVAEVRSRLQQKDDATATEEAGEAPAPPASSAADRTPTLPASAPFSADETPKLPPAAAITAHAAAGRKVLLIDDDDEFTRMAELYLQRAGLEVVTAGTGSEGMQILHQGDADLVCLAFHLPDMNGFHVADYLRRLHPVPPIFMVSAIADPQYEKQALRSGIERFFAKPVDCERFVGAVLARLGADLPGPPDRRQRPPQRGDGSPPPRLQGKPDRHQLSADADTRVEPFVRGRRLVFAVGS